MAMPAWWSAHAPFPLHLARLPESSLCHRCSPSMEQREGQVCQAESNDLGINAHLHVLLLSNNIKKQLGGGGVNLILPTLKPALVKSPSGRRVAFSPVRASAPGARKEAHIRALNSTPAN